MRILYVEDHKETRDEIAIFLRAFFDKVFVASNGEEGLALYEAHPVDLILSDIVMPKMDGFAMIEQIRQNDLATKIVVFSAHDDKDFLHKAIDAGVDGFLSKPIDQDRCLKYLCKVMEQIATKKELDRYKNSLEDTIAKQKSKIIETEKILIEQSKLASMGEMIGNIAHQWRQPLNLIALKKDIFYLDFFEKKITDEKVEAFNDELDDILQHMSKTIDDFRNFFKPSKQKVLFDLTKTIQEAMELLAASLKSHFVSWEIDGGDWSKIEIFGYPNEFQQALINIINNAKDAIIQKQQEIDFKTGHIKIGIKSDAKSATVTISDNAGGIDNEIIERIFEPYFTTKHKSQGTGIGLYMAKTIVETNMLGSLQVKNIENGALFTLQLPLAKA
jgi:signal transduction histidine kinase